jgi:hypothetical protein
MLVSMIEPAHMLFSVELEAHSLRDRALVMSHRIETIKLTRQTG